MHGKLPKLEMQSCQIRKEVNNIIIIITTANKPNEKETYNHA